MTGDAIRTRRSAVAIECAIRCASREPRFGQNHTRTPSARFDDTLPERDTRCLRHSCSKFWAYRPATAPESTTAMTFSSRDHESSVQFVEPVQTEAPSRTTYLWCIRSGQPGTPRFSNGSASISS